VQNLSAGLAPDTEPPVVGKKHFEKNINLASAEPASAPYGARAGSSVLSSQATFQFAPGADDSASRWRSENSDMMVGTRHPSEARVGRKPIEVPSARSSGTPFATSETTVEPAPRPVIRRQDESLLARVAASVASSIGTGAGPDPVRTAPLETTARRTVGMSVPMPGYTGRLPAGTSTAARDFEKSLPIV
jgi:hypothetical protein